MDRAAYNRPPPWSHTYQHPGPAAAIPPSPYTAVPSTFPAHYNPAQFAGQSGMFPGSAAATAAGALWQPGPQPRLAVMHQYQQQRLHATKVSRRVAIVNPDTGVELDIAAATNTASSQAGGDVSLAAGDDASTSPSGQTARRQVEVNTAEGVEVRQQFAERVSRLAADSSVTLRRQSESVSAKTVTATEEVISSPPPAVTPQQNGVLTEHECEEEEQNGEVAATPSHVPVSDEPNDDDAGDVEDKEVTVTTTVETAPVTSTSSVCDSDRDKNSVADTADQPDSSSATEQVRGASTSQQQQSGSRRSGRQKMRELGRRAEERQSGGDMDAFIDDRSCSDAAVTTTPPPPSEPASTATVKSSDDSPSDEPVPAATTTVVESADEAACSTAPAAVVPVESQTDEAEALEDGEIRDDVDDTTEAAVNGVTTTSQTPPPSSEPTPAPEPPVVMSERDLLIAAIRAIGGSKRCYSREEMETLQRHPLSHQRPLRLPDLPNVVRHSPLDPHRLVALRARGSAPMTGLVDLGSRSQGKLYRGGRGSQQGRRDLGMIQPQLLTQPMQQPIRRVEISLNRDVKLQSAENAWKAGHKANKQQLDETTTLLKSLTCLLNKITPSNVYKLIDEIKELKINTLAQLIRVIDVLFIKAVDEPSYAELYAKVCNGIFKTEVECSEEKSGKVTLRKVLLTKCQREFEKDKTLELNKDKRLAEIKAIKDEKERSLKKFELQEEARKIRLRSNGNLRFIGELYKLDLLTDRIMQLCIAKLIMEGHEDSYECLCKLLTTIGAKLEKSEMEHRILDQPFQEIQRLCTTTKVSSRVRFMMEDLVELRANKWVSKRVGDTAKPMTIEQVHEEARIEDANMRQRLALMEDRRHMATSRSSTGADRFRAGASSPGGAALRVGAGSMSASVGGWSTTPSRNFDSSRLMAVTNRSSSGGMPKMAKPGGDWSHGSMASAGGGGLSMTMRSTRGLPDLRSSSGVAMSANRFDALRSDTGADTTASPVTVAGKHGVTAGRPAGVRLSSSLSAANGSSKTAVSAGSVVSSAVPASSTAGQTRGSSGSSQQQQQQQRASGAVFTGRADVTAEKMAVKIPNMINELVQHGDFEESVGDCLRELHDKTVLMFIEQSVHSLIDLSDAKVRHMAGALHQQLLERHIITSQQYLAGLSETVPVLVDLVCDVPAMWTNLAELVAPVLLPVSCSSSTVTDPSGRCVISLSSLATAVKPAVEAGCGQALTRALFRRVLSLRGVAALRAIVPASFQWSSLLTRGEPAQLLAEWDMKYLVAGERAPLSPQCAAHLPQRLRHLISAVSEQTVGCGDDAALSSWLSEQGLMPDSDDQQTQEYQCALATDLLSALCFNCVLTNSGSDNSYVVDSERLERHAGLMKRAISPASCVTTTAGGGGEPGREVAALNGLTGLVNQLRHPPNLLDGLFRGLYDCDVIGEGSFVAWRDDTHVQVEGKGSAVASVHRFFNELLQQQDEGGATAPSLPH